MTLEMFLNKMEIHQPYRIFLGPEHELIDIQFTSIKRFLDCEVEEFHAERDRIIYILINCDYKGKDVVEERYYE